MCLHFSGSKLIFEWFADVDMIGDLGSRKLILGYVFTFVEGVVSWQFKLQKCVVLSTTEIEYITTNKVGKKKVLDEKIFPKIGFKAR